MILPRCNCRSHFWVCTFQTHEEPISSIWILPSPFLPSPAAVPVGTHDNYFQSRYEEMRQIGQQPNACQRCLNRRQQPWLSGSHHLLSDVTVCCKFPEKSPKSPSDLAEGSTLLVPVCKKRFLLHCPHSLPGPASRTTSFLLTLSLPQEIFLNNCFHKMYWDWSSLGLLKWCFAEYSQMTISRIEYCETHQNVEDMSRRIGAVTSALPP